MKKKIYAVGITAFVAIWFGLAAMSWFGPTTGYSYSERRYMATMPELNMDTLLAKDEKNPDGSIKKENSFMSKFENYTLDQFPFRDRFRQIKSVYQYYVMQQMDNNQHYVVGDHLSKLMYQIEETDLKANLSVITQVYEKYLKLKKANVYMAVIPEKGYYLAAQNGYLSLDYNKFFAMIQENLPEAFTHIDITGALDIDDYYYTDTHWRQEKIVPVAEALAEAMGVTVQPESAYTKEELERPFYGVYYGHAALPVSPEPMYLMHSQLLDGCIVRKPDTGETVSFYDMSMVDSKEMYDVFFSGNQARVEILNPNATTSKELVVFGDSFSRSIVPLLVQDYRKVTLVDLRNAQYYNMTWLLGTNQPDVLFLYSTVLLNGGKITM